MPEAVPSGGGVQRPGLPVVTPAEMAAIDAAAPEPTTELISRAGAAVARAAVRLLGGTYGRRVVVVAGPGNNGHDGRDAAVRLRRRGLRVVVVEALALPDVLPRCDLVIDAAFGTGFRGTWQAPSFAPGPQPRVLAVDIPSGIDGLTGVVGNGGGGGSSVMAADATVTFAAAKPGLLLGDGPALCGTVEVADIGLDVSGATMTWLDAGGVARLWPERPRHTHKWRSAVWVVAGAPGMEGAAALACAGAQRSGAGYVRLTQPTAPAGPTAPGGSTAPTAPDASMVPIEVVRVPPGATGLAGTVLAGAERFGAVVVGNGLGREPGRAADVIALAGACPVPLVIDADGLVLLAGSDHGPLGDHVVLTPHDGEFAALAGGPPGDDRVAATRKLAADLGAVVLLKGPTTVVAHPDGRVLLSTTTDARLATAGTGDVLAGMVGALCAQGLAPFEAAGAAAFCHARAADLGLAEGLVASDVAACLPAAIASLRCITSPNESDTTIR